MNTVLRGCSVEFVWCGVLGAFLRMCWRVRVCAPADLPPAQGYRIEHVEAMTEHCDARSPVASRDSRQRALPPHRAGY